MFRLILAFLRPALDFASMGAGIFAGLEGQFQASHLPNAHYYMPSGTAPADADWTRAMQAIAAATDRNTGMVDQSILQSYSQMLGIDLAPLVQAGAAAGGQYEQLAAQAKGFQGAMQGQGDAIWNAAADPRSQIHDFQRGQAIDTSRAADTSRGVAMSPYSSGNESTAVRNFEMDWQNQQLNRMRAGSQGAGQAYDASFGYGAAQPAATQMAAQVPIQAQQQVAQAPMDYASQFTNAQNFNVMQPNMGMQNQAMGYMPFATGVASGQYNQDFQRAMMQYQMMNKAQGQLNMGYDLNSGAGNPASYMGMGGMGGGGGGGMPSGLPG
jgi:hypothetical protein